MPTPKRPNRAGPSATRTAPSDRRSALDWVAEHWQSLLAGIALMVMFGFFLLLKLFALHPTYSDENIYFYMAKATADRGLLPYRDYFFAHPPLQLVPLVIIWKLSGGHWIALKIVSWVAAMVCGLMLYLMAARCWGRLEGVLATGLFLFSVLVLMLSSHGLGVNEACALALIGLWFLSRQRVLAAGVMLGLALQTGMYALPAVTATGIFLAVTGWRRLGSFLIGFSAAWGAVTLLMVAISGKEFLRDVLGYPLKMPSGKVGAGFGAGVELTVLFHFYLFWMALLGVIAFVVGCRRSRRPAGTQPAPPGPKGGGTSQTHAAAHPVEPQIGFRDGLWAKPQQRLVAICLVLLVLVLASISRLGNVLTYYFLMMFPPVVLLTAYGIGAWLRAAAGWTVPRLREEPAWHAHSRTILVAGVVVLISLWPARAGYRALLDMPPGPIGAPLEYGWYDAPLPEWVNRLVRDDFWENHGYLMQGGNPVTNYLQYQSLNHFDVAHEVAAFIRQHTRPNETIFGDMDIAPVIALLSNRRLAANIVDTGAMRFATGSLEPESCWRRVSRDRLAYVVTRRPKGDLASVPEMTVLIERDCVLVRRFLGQFPGDLYIYEPRTRAGRSRGR